MLPSSAPLFVLNGYPNLRTANGLVDLDACVYT